MFHVKRSHLTTHWIDIYVSRETMFFGACNVSRETIKEVKMINDWFKRNKQRKCDIDDAKDIVEKCHVYYIPCGKIRSNAMRSRCYFDEDKLVLLAYSIKKYGIIEPLCVRATEEDDIYDYELIAGERRLRAARLAGLSVVPCIIYNVELLSSAELSIIENLYSEKLNEFEVAAALKRTVDVSGYSLEEISTRLCIPQSDLTNKAWLLELTYDERQILLNVNASESLAVCIAKISNLDKRAKVFEYILSTNAAEPSIYDYINSLEKESQNSFYEIPRDVSSVIKSFTSKINFLNRHKKRANIEFGYNSDGVENEIKIEICIKY